MTPKFLGKELPQSWDKVVSVEPYIIKMEMAVLVEAKQGIEILDFAIFHKDLELVLDWEVLIWL